MITYQSLEEVFIGLKRQARWRGVNSFSIEYRSSVIEGMPKLDYHFFDSAEELDLILGNIRSSILPPQKYALERIERIQIVGRYQTVAKIRAIYDPS